MHGHHCVQQDQRSAVHVEQADKQRMGAAQRGKNSGSGQRRNKRSPREPAAGFVLRNKLGR